MTPDIPLGRKVDYPTRVDAGVLFAIPRSGARNALGIVGELPFTGVDIWNAWELSWLDPRGKPCIAVAELRVPCASANLVESKSLKLYLGGYAMTRFEHAQAVRERIATDVSACVGERIEVVLREPAAVAATGTRPLPGDSLDAQDVACSEYARLCPELLTTTAGAEVDESLVTHLFRSHCPVTGQPDWGSIRIRYRGRRIERAGLLRYLVSFREHPGFHEACVERIFMDVRTRCAPRQLLVQGRFLRRGGIDINPWRATPGFDVAPGNPRDPRQ